MPTEKLGAEKEPQSPTEPPNGTESRQSMASTAGLRSRLGKRSGEAEKKHKQLADYTAWVNNYLKRKPGVPLITDIRVNLQDGISFVNLVEIVSRTEVEGVDRYPTNAEARRVNIELAVQFLKQDGVNIQGEAVRDILEGNSKGIMRVVLGIAERYQPRSVKPRSASDPKPYANVQSHSLRDHVTTGKHVTDHVPLMRRPSPDMPLGARKSNLTTNCFSVPNISRLNQHTQLNPGGGQSLSQTTPPAAPPPHVESTNLSQPYSSYHPLTTATMAAVSDADQENDMYSMPIDHLPPSASTRIIAPIRKKGVQLKLRPGSAAIHSIPEDRELLEGGVARRASMGAMSGGVVPGGLLLDPGMTSEISDMLSGLNQFKTELLQLHAVLLRNTDGSEINLRGLKENSKEGVTSKEKSDSVRDIPLEVNSMAMLVEKQHLLTQKEAEMSGMRDQFSQLQDEYTQVTAECTTLRTMVEERDAFIKTMKTEIYRKEYKNDTAKVDLHNQLLQKDAIIKKLESEVQSCQHTLDSNQADLEDANHRLDEHKSKEIELKVEIDSLKMELARLSTMEEALQTKISTRDRKIGGLEDKIADLYESRARRVDSISEDTENIREAIMSLRQTLPPHDPQQQTIDGLEQAISVLLGKVMERTGSPTGKRTGSPTGKRSKRHGHRGDDDHHRDRERDRERRRRHKEKHSSHAEAPRLDSGATPPSGSAATKVVYYIVTDKKETPYATVVPKRSDTVTLRDFKTVFDRPGSYRFFVKTEDPDCGVVKEEIKRDDKPLPSWKGRILVWVTEKSHHR